MPFRPGFVIILGKEIRGEREATKWGMRGEVGRGLESGAPEMEQKGRKRRDREGQRYERWRGKRDTQR